MGLVNGVTEFLQLSMHFGELRPCNDFHYPIIVFFNAESYSVKNQWKRPLLFDGSKRGRFYVKEHSFLFCRLLLLFQSLDERRPLRYQVYYHLIQIASKVDQVLAVFKNVQSLKQQFALSPPSNEQFQKLLRLLHQALLNSKQG